MALSAKQLANLGDKYSLARDARLAKEKEAEALKEVETGLKAQLIEGLQEAKIDGVTGKLKRAELARKDIIVAENWEALYAYIHKNKAYDLLQKRVSSEAVKERWADNKKVPGVKAEQMTTISLTKVKNVD